MLIDEKLITHNMHSGILPMSFGIVGSGTAGLITAIYLRKVFPLSSITIVSSSNIGIIGVGEGSTEHWAQFMDACDIPREEMIEATSATHKYGIRFENWSTHTKDYFHSVGEIDDIYAHGLFAGYMGFEEQGKLFTTQTSSVGLVKDKISRQSLHKGTNQFHFDTNKLNEYFTSLAFKRGVKFVDASVKAVHINAEYGTIDSVTTEFDETVSADFWFDASGFNRILMKGMGADTWVSFSDYLLCNTAIPFPTESDPSGKIKAYTRARAASSGWVWEIPTQERRGNGYVFSSDFISTDEAVSELQIMTGHKIENPRVISFDAGHIKDCWVKNCCAVGLSSSFVEPLEASSIGSSIQQIKHLIPYLASYTPSSSASQKHYNRGFEKMMRNILSMIRMHYYSDKKESKFWEEMAHMPINEELQMIIDLWAERPPSRYDFDSSSGEMFLAPHMAHVAQGQGLLNSDSCTRAINRLNIREELTKKMDDMRHNRHNHELVDHATALREIGTIDSEWV